MQGLSTAVYGPAIGGILGGSNYNILGPAGALVNILNKFSTQYGGEIIPWLAFFGGVLSFLVFALRLEKYCMLIPVSVLEGFSASVAIAIGFGQFNAAFGLYGLTHFKEFYMNVYTTFSNIGSINMVEFIPFLIMFIALFALLKVYPSKPWIIVIAVIGNIYGIITARYAENIKPKLLLDIYPDMKEGRIGISLI
jgi:SulP family sulfate permease